MAVTKFCPRCEAMSDCTRKGKTKKGEQIWLCKNCRKTFRDSMIQTQSVAPETENQINEVKKTVITVNNQVIAEITDNLTESQIKGILLSYYDEISETPQITTEDGVKKVDYHINVGTKG